MELSLGEIYAKVRAEIVTEFLQDQVFELIHSRGNRTLEYVEFLIEQARNYEEATNYGAW